jgi:hypothetical protein
VDLPLINLFFWILTGRLSHQTLLLISADASPALYGSNDDDHGTEDQVFKLDRRVRESRRDAKR